MGVGGVAAIGFNAIAEGRLETDFFFFSGLIGGFLFVYAALFGTLPWGEPSRVEEGEMSKSKWQLYWIAIVGFLVMTTTFLARKGVFREADIVVFALVGLMFAVVGVALYFYIKNRAEDFNIKW